jgi:hypothetical protein
MLPLTRPKRQILATLALLAFTVAPTGYVGWMAWRIQRPEYRHEVERQIGQALGLRVALDAVRYPRPGTVVYRGVVLRQEELRRKGWIEIARAAEIRLGRGGGELTVAIDGLRLRGESPRQAMAQIAALLQRAGEAPEFPSVSVTAPECELVLGNGEQGTLRYRLKDVIGNFRADALAPAAIVSYRITDEESSTRCELTLTRDRRGEAVRTTLAFKTMEGLPLPARVLDLFFDSAAWLGSQARVDGSLTLSQTGGSEWEAEFQGNLYDIDLATLVSRRFPDHRLTGLARVAIRSARWADRPGAAGFGWVEADGELAATSPGTIGLSLVRALRSEMNFGLKLRQGVFDPELPFRSLAFTFQINRDGEIQIGGGFGAEYPQGVVMIDAAHDEPVVFAPPGAANVLGLVNALVPKHDDSVLVSGGREAQVLQSYLPLPPARGRRAEPLRSN